MTAKILDEETTKLASTSPLGEKNKFALAAKYFLPEVTGEIFSDFLTTLLYDEVITPNAKPIDLSKL